MKKLFYFMAALAVIVGLASCKCTSDSQNAPKLDVEKIVSLDRENMFVNYGEDYKWFEACVELDNYLDADTTLAVAKVVNVFQVQTEVGEGNIDTEVIRTIHTFDIDTLEVVTHAFWVEDKPLNDVEVALTFSEALERLMEANLPKPHSKQAVLRKELGPQEANAQYIFGNTEAHVYVDAVTGDVNDKNPVFPVEGE